MFQIRHLGKILLIVALGAAVSAAAFAQPGPEDPWRLLVRQQYRQAGKQADLLGGPLGRWFGAVADARLQAAGSTAPDDGISRVALMLTDGDFGSAVAPLDSLVLAWAGKDTVAENFFRLQQGRVAIETGRIAAADSILTVGLAGARALDLPLQEFFALYQRGRARLRLRQIDPPRQDLEAALEIAVAEDLPRWAGDAALARSVVDRLQMDLDGARRWRQKALEQYRRADYPVGQARALHYLGVIDLMEGKLARAVAGFSEALDLARRAGDQKVEGAVLGEMAGANYLLGDFDAALDQYDEAMRLVDNPWRKGMMMTNIGSIHEYRREYGRAREILPRALELIRQAGDRRNEAQVLMSLGEVLCELKEFDQGLAYLDQALDIAREYEIPLTEAWILKVKGHGLLDKGDLEGAAAALAQATTIARRIGYFEILEWSLLGQGMVARRQGDLEAALQHLEEALAEVAEVRRRSGESSSVAGGVTSQAVPIYAETIDVMYALHRRHQDRGLDRRAFAVNQDAKARVLLNLLTEAEYDLNLSAVPGYRRRESDLLRDLAALDQREKTARDQGAPADTLGAIKARRAAAEDKLSALEASLREKDPRYAEVLYPRPVGLEDLQQKVLRPGELFLDYALGDSASYLWAVTRDESRFVRLPDRGELSRLVRTILPLLADYNLTAGAPAYFLGPAYALYRSLLEPVADMVDEAERLIISPAGILYYVPFGALPRSDDPADDWGSVPFLIRDKVVWETPSASVLERVRSRPPVPADAGWLLVGDPVLTDAVDADVFAHAAGAVELAPLPLAGRELADLSRLAPAAGTVLLTGPRATIGALTAAGEKGPYAQVHLATHGLFNPNHPRYSGLVLSPDEHGAGFLSAGEVFGLHLDCGQVVLAACASGLGRQVSGEGVVGLVRSFLFAGARSVVATLWNVSGEATERLMSSYYGQLAEKEGGDRAGALCAAKRAMIDGTSGPLTAGLDTAFPGFWAGFILSGEGAADD